MNVGILSVQKLYVVLNHVEAWVDFDLLRGWVGARSFIRNTFCVLMSVG